MEVDSDLQVMQTPDAAEAAYSYIAPIGYGNSTECGYCRGTRDGKRHCYYASTTSLTPSLYQSLLDRGWRRSGTLLYRTNQKEACCPHYTLRLDSHHYKPAKDQRQAVNRFNKYVTGEVYAKEANRLYPLPHQEARRRDNQFDLVQRVHEAEAELLRTPLEPAHRFEVTLEPDTFTEEKYTVFENYQRNVHKEPPSKITPKGFTRFLCRSPLRREKFVDTDGTERRLGSFHQCYRLDGKLVAIGVLDLLPHGVSAVYFAYHDSIHAYSPGKLGAMREIALAAAEGYRWWYPGFYIHGCPKMRYKIDYSPQYVLDPEAMTWDLLDDDALAIFDSKPYVSLSRERRVQEPDHPEAGNSMAGQDSDMEISTEDTLEDEEIGKTETEDPDSCLFLSNMPGIPSLEDMLQVNIDNLRVCSGFCNDLVFRTAHLSVWETEEVSDLGSFKSRVAELVAATGPDLMDEICLDLRRRRRSSG